MAQYLLDCQCGNQVTVSTAQAGQNVRCTCGAELAVPTLRGLKDLREATTTAGQRPRRAWDNRSRVAFTLFVIGLFSLAIAVYLIVTLPPIEIPRSSQEVREWFETSSAGKILEVYRDLSRGLRPVDPELLAFRQYRDYWQWVASIALGVAVTAFVGGAVAIFTRPRAKESVQKASATSAS